MFKYAFSVVVGLAFALSAMATEFVVPEQKITGADKVHKLGRLVKLDVTGVKDKPEHYQSSTYKWKIYEVLYDNNRMPYISALEDTVAVDSGVFFGAGVENRKLTAEVIIVHTYVVKDKDGKITEVGNKLNVVTTDVNIGSETPGPGPGPGPGPDPSPTFPDGKFKLSKVVYDIAMKTVTVDKQKGAAAVANGCNAVAASIAAGVLKDPAEILKTLREKNNANLEAQNIKPATWDAFGIELQKELLKLYKDKKLLTVSDYADAFKEIADGLSKVK